MNIPNIIKHFILPFIVVLFSTFSSTLYAQNDFDEERTRYYIPIEANAEFVGGDKALKKFIKRNFNYPASALEKNLKGTVKVRFTINTDGSVSDIELTKKVDPEVDKEAIRVVKLTSGHWQAAIRGVAVKSKYNLPFVFGN